MPDPDPGAERIQVPLVWIGNDEEPILFCNRILTVVGTDNEAIVTFGQSANPPLMGSPEEIQETLKGFEFVPIRTLARFSVSRRRIKQFIEVLESTLEKVDKAHEFMED